MDQGIFDQLQQESRPPPTLLSSASAIEDKSGRIEIIQQNRARF
jgi:hypothetical protein